MPRARCATSIPIPIRFPLASVIQASRHRSRNAHAPELFGRCAFERSPRARGTPGSARWQACAASARKRTHGLRPLATPKRGGDPAKDRRPSVLEPQVRLLSGVPRAVFIGLLRATPGGLSFQVPYAAASSGPTHRFESRQRLAVDTELQRCRQETRDANPWRRDRAAWAAALGVRVAPVRGHRRPVPLNDASRSALGWTGLGGL